MAVAERIYGGEDWAHLAQEGAGQNQPPRVCTASYPRGGQVPGGDDLLMAWRWR